MNLKVGQRVLVSPKCGPAGGHEFMARIDKIDGDNIRVVDQEDDAFDVETDEISSLHSGETCRKCGSPLDIEGNCEDETCPYSDTTQDTCPYCKSGLMDEDGCQKCGL